MEMDIIVLGTVGCASVVFLLSAIIICYKAIKRLGACFLSFVSVYVIRSTNTLLDPREAVGHAEVRGQIMKWPVPLNQLPEVRADLAKLHSVDSDSLKCLRLPGPAARIPKEQAEESQDATVAPLPFPPFGLLEKGPREVLARSTTQTQFSVSHMHVMWANTHTQRSTSCPEVRTHTRTEAPVHNFTYMCRSSRQIYTLV